MPAEATAQVADRAVAAAVTAEGTGLAVAVAVHVVAVDGRGLLSGAHGAAGEGGVAAGKQNCLFAPAKLSVCP